MEYCTFYSKIHYRSYCEKKGEGPTFLWHHAICLFYGDISSIFFNPVLFNQGFRILEKLNTLNYVIQISYEKAIFSSLHLSIVVVQQKA